MSATNEALAALPPIDEIVDVYEPEPEAVLDSIASIPPPGVDPAAVQTDPVVDPPAVADPAVADPAVADPKAADPAAVVDPELSDKAKAFDSLVQTYTQNPVGYIRELITRGQLSAQQLAELGIAAPGQVPAAQAADEDGWNDTDLTVPEKFIKQSRGLISQLPQFAGEVQQTFGQHSQYITHLMNENAALHARIDALSELNDVKLPAHEFKGYDPKQHEAYRETLKTVVSTRKAAVAPTPKTPQNSAASGSAPAGIAPGSKDFVQIFKELSRQAKG